MAHYYKAVLLILLCAPAHAKTSCDLSRVVSLGGWSNPAVEYWRGTIAKLTAERVDVFLQTGRFVPITGQMHGNTYSVTNAKIVRTTIVEREQRSAKVQSGKTVPGTEIPIYEIVASADQDAHEAITVRDLAFRLPIDSEYVSKHGVMPIVSVDATCKSTGIPAVAGAIYRKR